MNAVSLWRRAWVVGAAVLLAAAPVLARDEIEKRVSKDVAARGRTLVIETSVSSLVVETESGDRFRAVAVLEFWANDPLWMQAVEAEFDIQVREDSDRVEFRVELPKHPRKRGWSKHSRVHYSVKMRVTVPQSTTLAIENQYGNVEVRGVGGPLQVVNQSGEIRVAGSKRETILQGRYGNIVVSDVDGALRAESVSGAVEVRAIRGRVDLSSQYGDVKVNDIEGDLEVSATSGSIGILAVDGTVRAKSSYGNVDIQRVTGALYVSSTSGNVTASDIGQDAELSSSYGFIHAREITGDLEMKVTSGGARASDVGGSLRLTGTYGDVLVENIEGAAEVSGGNGSVTVSNVGGALDVRCSYGTVRVRDVGGSLTVSASSTAISAVNIAGSVEVETSYSSVRLRDIDGLITVRNQNGPVSVRNLLAGAREGIHRIETSYADIDFAWPRDLPVSFRLESTYGRISTDLPGVERKNGSRRVFEGAIGTGGAELWLVTKSGSIRLRAE